MSAEIVIVGFNIHTKKSIVYGTFKTKDGATRAFRRYLDTPDIQFMSIRKINPNRGESNALERLCKSVS